MKTHTDMAGIIAWLAGIMTGLVVLIFPLGYFFLAYQHEAGGLEAEAEINARIITQTISANPEMWEFEQARLKEQLSE